MLRLLATSCLLTLGACAGPGAVPRDLAHTIAEEANEQPVRLCLVNDRIACAAVPVDPHDLPAAVRTALQQLAPGGREVFSGREWGERGAGWRIERDFEETPGVPAHRRSFLLAADGRVLERAHTLPLARVPARVLAEATAFGRDIRSCAIVSDGAVETGWRLTVARTDGRQFVIESSLDGRIEQVQRLVTGAVAVR